MDKNFSMKTRAAVRPKKQPAAEIPSGLSATEQDLVRHVHNGYQLETDSLGGDPLRIVWHLQKDKTAKKSRR